MSQLGGPYIFRISIMSHDKDRIFLVIGPCIFNERPKYFESLRTVYFRKPYIFAKGQHIFREKTVYFQFWDRIFSAKTVYFTVYPNGVMVSA